MMKRLVRNVVRVGKRSNFSLAKEKEDAAAQGPRVVVIGGGCAGLTAADHLHCHGGMGEVLLLEATDRLGGRVLSGWVGDTQVELGSQNIGAASITNPVYNLANSLGSELKKEGGDQTLFICGTTGREIRHFAPQMMLFKKIMREIPQGSQTPFMQYMRLRIDQELLNCPPKDKDDWETVLYGLANNTRQVDGGDPDSYPAWGAALRKVIPGKTVTLKSGNSILMTNLAARIPPRNIHLHEEVTKIVWGEGVDGAVVKTSTGHEYKADHVIVTLPAGVLLEREDLFCPQLPAVKKKALQSLNLTAKDVVMMEYDEPWWGGPKTEMVLGWHAKDLLQTGNWALGLKSICPVSSTVLAVTFLGEEARIVEESADEEVGAELTSLLRRLLQDSTLPYPRHILITRWAMNKYSRGSYIGVSPRADQALLEEISKPVTKDDPVILFAGDATVPSHLGRLPAARLSGLREANRIIELQEKRFK